MSGVGSVLLGLVYRMAVKISLPRAPCRKLFQFFDFVCNDHSSYRVDRVPIDFHEYICVDT